MVDGEERARTQNLMAAVVGGHAEVVKFLINRKANVNLAEPCNGLTALHRAASCPSSIFVGPQGRLLVRQKD
jgi:ankyrin repeat protein